MSSDYRDSYTRSIHSPEEFWLDAARLVSWDVEPTRALDDSRAPIYRWFPDGMLNTCYNALDRHVLAGRGDSTAVIFHSAYGERERFSYAEFTDLVAVFAGALRAQGVGKGDTVLIYMPMIPQALVAMLACARLGAVHSVVFGGFAAPELATRIDDATPKVIVMASCGIEPSRIVEYAPIVGQALALSSHQPDRVIVYQREQHRAELGPLDIDWQDAVDGVEPAECVSVKATDPLYILYTSGTTGRPKGVVRDNGGHAVALSWSISSVYDIRAGDVFWTASDIGWVVGHSYIVYAPLFAGATTVLYEGKPVGTPDAGAFWRIAAEYGVKALFTAPTALRAVRKVDPEGRLVAGNDLATLQTVFLAGERLDPETYHWASELLTIPIVDHWWQTESGWPICANPRGFDPMTIKAGSPSLPMPGYDVHVLDENGDALPAGIDGALAIRLPLPPGTMASLWRDDDRFVESYLTKFPGFYESGDGGYIDEDGYVFVMGRIDDVINVAGHRLSTGSMEAVVATHPAVAECAVIGVDDAVKGQVPRAFVVLKAGAEIDPDVLEAEIIASMRASIGAVASLRDVTIVIALPKTRSGKVLRKTMRDIAAQRDTVIPSTIEDASVLDALRPALLAL
ncbi:MAG: prpE [Microbacteriaceae bacterium]|nr:prpE [Microbacteriaceae bacterium]